MSNEKQVWLYKKYRKLKKRVNYLLIDIKHEKDIISSFCKSGNLSIAFHRSLVNLRTLRKTLKEYEKEIRIVKQLIKETK